VRVASDEAVRARFERDRMTDRRAVEIARVPRLHVGASPRHAEFDAAGQAQPRRRRRSDVQIERDEGFELQGAPAVGKANVGPSARSVSSHGVANLASSRRSSMSAPSGVC